MRATELGLCESVQPRPHLTSLCLYGTRCDLAARGWVGDDLILRRLPGEPNGLPRRYRRWWELWRALPVIVVSAYTFSMDVREALEAGTTGYLTKPVVFWELKPAVEQTLHIA